MAETATPEIQPDVDKDSQEGTYRKLALLIGRKQRRGKHHVDVDKEKARAEHSHHRHRMGVPLETEDKVDDGRSESDRPHRDRDPCEQDEINALLCHAREGVLVLPVAGQDGKDRNRKDTGNEHQDIEEPDGSPVPANAIEVGSGTDTAYS